MIHSDLHIHSEYSYDAKLPLAEILRLAKERGYRQVGITDHLNLPNNRFIECLRNSAVNVKKVKETEPMLLLGVELTPIEKPFYDYIVQNPDTYGYGHAPNYTPPTAGVPIPYQLELALSKEELMSYGVQYAVAAAHGYIDMPNPDVRNLQDCIKSYHRMQMYLACDERTTILGHPYYHGLHIWDDDLSVFPQSMHEELAAALKENGKLVEYNRGMILVPYASERFKHQYTEFIRFLFEYGIRVTYGSDAHSVYPDAEGLDPYLKAAGFKEGDFSELEKSDLWQ